MKYPCLQGWARTEESRPPSEFEPRPSETPPHYWGGVNDDDANVQRPTLARSTTGLNGRDVGADVPVGLLVCARVLGGAVAGAAV